MLAEPINARQLSLMVFTRLPQFHETLMFIFIVKQKQQATGHKLRLLQCVQCWFFQCIVDESKC